MGIALGVLVGWACHHFAGSEQSAKEIASYFSMVTDIFPVSYTHLTLPTSDLV